MNYQQTIDYLFTKLPMYSRIGASAYKKDLTNTIALCQALGNPQHKLKTIHIAGTNGKGSTSHMLAAILQSAGYKTGLYTSPHLKDFRERIKINGIEVSEAFVISFTERIKPLIETLQPSFFEITVAMAFDFFAQQKVDIAVIEVGLGGRLDSTNIISPEVSAITNIGWDHMQMLGDTLEKIATEKAGIIKQGTPVVIGEIIPETEQVFSKIAKQQNAPMLIADRERWVSEWKYEHHLLSVTVANKHNDDQREYQLDLPGFYQTKNLLTVLEIIHQLKIKGWKIEENNISSGLQHVKKLTGLHGRWEVIHQHPTIILDVGHNEDGFKQILAQLEITEHKNLHIVMGMVKDKEVDHILSLLPKHAYYYFTRAQIPRAMPEADLMNKAFEHELTGHAYENVNIAIKRALGHAHKDDLILVCGSVFLVGEVERQINYD
jgi:dihydrofolate synthase/folylpolyglutamate synthase